MKIHVLSDLHLEFRPFELPEVGADILILAGDTAPRKKGIEWVKSLNLKIPVIYIMGNHEYYRAAYPKLLHDLKILCEGTNIHLLENESFEFGGINFLGCTLWTDFRLFNQPVASELTAQFAMNDYKLIRRSPRYSKLRPSDTRIAFTMSIDWMEKQLEKNPENTIVVTHHAPSSLSIPEAYKNDELNPAFASNLDDFILKYQPKLWIHGHIHTAVSYLIGDTRIICNPRAYPGENMLGFDSQFIFEV